MFSQRKLSSQSSAAKKESFDGWSKCTSCSEIMHRTELASNFNCCPACDYHYRISADERIAQLADKETFTPYFTDLVPIDSLGFCDLESYPSRLAKAAEKSGQMEAAVVGICRLAGIEIVLGALDFTFMGGSMGSVVGEKITRGIELAQSRRLPLVIAAVSGGARMQESIFSLMQMAKTAAALARLETHKLPYISILTNPTAGGVTASFGSLGDIIIAEPRALICFAGPRVVEQTTRQKIPAKAQRAEFLLERGMIDCIAHRRDLKCRVAQFLGYLAKQTHRNISNNVK